MAFTACNEQQTIPNKIKPVCAIVEYANKRLTRFWYNAEIEPTAIDNKLANTKIFDQINEKSKNIKKQNLIRNEYNIILGAEENNIVTINIEPS